MTDMAVDPTASAAPSEGPSGRKRRLTFDTAVELFAIPVIVVIGLVSFVIWHQTSSAMDDSVVASALKWSTIRLQVRQHVVITAVSALFVVLIAVPLGVALTRPGIKKATPVVIAIANIGQSAPAVGLIVLLSLTALGTGFRTAVIALVFYAILPVLSNTIAGLQAVDATLVEAGRGIGMSNLSVLFRIELPLAVPVIMSGIRTALVLLVGTATLATFINAGGLGDSLVAGISLFRFPVMFWSATLVALLALLVEWVGRILELLARPKGI